MKILVDTSVWSLALRRTTNDANKEAEQLKRFIQNDEQLFIIGVILQEILQGISFSKKFDELQDYLSAFPLLRLYREDYIFAAKLRNYCRSKGIQAGTVDFLIAGAAINNGCYLFTTDKDFQHIADYSDLKLLPN